MEHPRRARWPALIVAMAASTMAASACSSSGPGVEEGLVATTTTSTTSTTSTSGPRGPTTATPAAGASGGPAWVACQNNAGPAGFQCATIQVPLDYRDPGRRSITLALDRRPASGTKVGSLLVNPGGPGVSGVDGLAYLVSLLSPAVLERFDVVGFDPRGVARSAPIRCLDGPALDRILDLDPTPATDAGFQALVAAARSLATACLTRSGDVLPFVGTDSAARDMDRIRQAVGDAKLTFLGFSYGTFLGATYAELFPAHLRAMILDGAVDPALDPVAVNISQSTAFDKELDAFFADCSSRASCLWKPGGDLHAAFDALMAQIRVRRLPGVGARTVGPDQALYGVLAALYDKATWSTLADALNQASHSSGSLLLQLFDGYVNRGADGTYGNQQEANNAINCADAPWPTDPNTVRQIAARAAQAAPEFGVADLYGGLNCVFWPVPATGHPHAIRANGSPPIVVVGSTGDPATPYAEAQALASELQHGVLISRVGDGHTGYRSSACVRAAVDRYLIDLTVPANGTSCSSP